VLADVSGNWECCDSPLAEKVLQGIKRSMKRTARKKRSYIQENSHIIKGVSSKGRRLIKIQILDVETAECRNILNAQYVVTDHIDPILDQTEHLINNISKNICGYSYNF
jgi:hypothetical protein